MPETSRLDDVANVYAGYGPPPVVQSSRIPVSLGDLIRESSRSIEGRDEVTVERDVDALQLAIISLGRCLRQSPKPKSALHVLLLDDNLTIGQIAARADLDPLEVEVELAPLVSVGLVYQTDSGSRPRFTVPGISTE